MSYEALQCTSLSKNFKEAIEKLTLQKVERVPLKKGEVRVQIYAAAVNFFDLLMLCGQYQHKPALPFTAGTEASGTVIEVGPGVPSYLKPGVDVMIGMSTGAMGDEMITPALNCIPKPKEFSHVEAAGLFVGYSTAYNGLVQRGKLREGETLLVTGAGGGMGMAAVQLGKALGATVIAVASGEDKLAAAKKVGADHTILVPQKDLKSSNVLRDQVNKITKNKGVDVVYDVVGGDLFDQCVRIMGDEGRLLVIGFASGRIPAVPANLPLVKGFSVVGVRAGESMRRHPEYAMEMFQALNGFTSKGHLRPFLEKVYQRGEYREAFAALANRSVVGKSVIQWREAPAKL
ncbi:alcohol dehydrogenase [Planoprotostelium fungivorum]|uniref:Alcohol dehydrogenase n=1 Tax=Planoprotostelium fungivorum TaxID=1890364 RepID=A0A2P6NMW5_9EUKA|nr:alcohol dehydrogenase [Planoprotostelium fungivorum]